MPDEEAEEHDCCADCDAPPEHLEGCSEKRITVQANGQTVIDVPCLCFLITMQAYSWAWDISKMKILP